MSPIPWATILTHGPAIVMSARRLLATARAREGHESHHTLDARLNELEKASLESARLLQEMAQQIEAIANAQQDIARRVRIVMALAIVATIFASAATVLALIW
jgi:hypothetical protein